MSVQFPSHLYIRVDRDLRSALARQAEAAGETVSALARRELRTALTGKLDPRDPSPAGPAAQMQVAA